MTKHKNHMPEQLLLFPESELDHIKKKRIIRILSEELSAPVDIELTLNRSLVLSSRKRHGTFQVRMHQAFLHADHRIIKAVADLIKKGSKPARIMINEYLKTHSRQIQPKRKTRALILNAQGKTYDLMKIMREIKTKYGIAKRGVKITWSNARLHKRQQSIRLGSYNHDEKLIRVHPSLDNPSVPKYFVEYIVYHELLHALVPPQDRPGRRNFHPREYHHLEKQFEHFKEARKYEKYITNHWLD